MHHTLLNFFRKIVKNLKIHASNCATCHITTCVGVATIATFATLDTSATSLPLATALHTPVAMCHVAGWPLAVSR